MAEKLGLLHLIPLKSLKVLAVADFLIAFGAVFVLAGQIAVEGADAEGRSDSVVGQMIVRGDLFD